MTPPHWVTGPRLRAAVRLLLVLGVLAFLVRGADRPADPGFESEAARSPLAGFGTVAGRSVGPDGTVSEWCALLAASTRARQQGLMGRTDLAGFDAMVFRFDQPSTGSFYMFRTPLPLSIAFLDGEGRLVSSSDMAPCRSDDPAACPRYGAAGPYRHAVEAPAGGLAALGIVEGATVTFGGPCA